MLKAEAETEADIRQRDAELEEPHIHNATITPNQLPLPSRLFNGSRNCVGSDNLCQFFEQIEIRNYRYIWNADASMLSFG